MINVSESTTTNKVTTISVFDSITATENIQPQLIFNISVIDNIIVTDVVVEEEFLNVNITENIFVSESVGIFQNIFAFSENWTSQTQNTTGWEDQE